MPIRINLLAAELEAEELRRKDPIKRAIFGGSAVVVLILGWISITQLKVMAARSELWNQTNQLAKAELTSKQIRISQLAAMEGTHRIRSLDQYTANRFLWGNFLDALQHTVVDNIRLSEIHAEQRNSTTDTAKFFTTNLVVSYVPDAPSWKFWASRPEQPSTEKAVMSQLAAITNAAPFTTNSLKYTIKITETGTNAIAAQVTTQVDFSIVPTATENITVEIRGRDYSTTPGAAIDEFTKHLTSSPYFKQILSPAHGYRFTERPPQPRPDPTDPINPGALFVPFTIELVLDARTFINDETVQR